MWSLKMKLVFYFLCKDIFIQFVFFVTVLAQVFLFLVTNTFPNQCLPVLFINAVACDVLSMWMFSVRLPCFTVKASFLCLTSGHVMEMSLVHSILKLNM